MNRRAAVLGVVLVASLGLGVALRAATTATQDPNDTTGTLDVETVKVIRERGRSPKWLVRTFAVWTIDEMWDRGYVSVELDTRFDEDADFYALVRSLGNRLEATLFRIRPDKQNDLEIATLQVAHESSRTASVWIPLRKVVFGPSRTTFDWWVITTFTSGRCPATCFDRVPDQGGVTMPIPGVSPSPSPTTTPPPTSFAPPPGD